MLGAQQCPGAADRNGQHGNLRGDGGSVGAQAEGAQPGHPPEGAFGKHAERRAALHHVGEPARVLDTPPRVESLHELCPQSPQVDARHRLMQELALGHEADVRGKRGKQRDAVEIAGVVRHHYAGRAWQMLETADRRLIPARLRMMRAASRLTRHAAVGCGASAVHPRRRRKQREYQPCVGP